MKQRSQATGSVETSNSTYTKPVSGSRIPFGLIKITSTSRSMHIGLRNPVACRPQGSSINPTCITWCTSSRSARQNHAYWARTIDQRTRGLSWAYHKLSWSMPSTSGEPCQGPVTKGCKAARVEYAADADDRTEPATERGSSAGLPAKLTLAEWLALAALRCGGRRGARGLTASPATAAVAAKPRPAPSNPKPPRGRVLRPMPRAAVGHSAAVWGVECPSPNSTAPPPATAPAGATRCVGKTLAAGD